MDTTISSQVQTEFDITTVHREPPATPGKLAQAFNLPGVGLVVGPSGCGKSCALRGQFNDDHIEWGDGPISDHFSSYESAVKFLGVTGLNSVPQWLKPHAEISTGEQARADIALGLDRGSRAFDEFTSTVSRNVAKAICYGLNRLINTDIVLATCHYDVIEWLNWDWCYDFSTDDVVVSNEHRQVSWRTFLRGGVEVDGFLQRY